MRYGIGILVIMGILGGCFLAPRSTPQTNVNVSPTTHPTSQPFIAPFNINNPTGQMPVSISAQPVVTNPTTNIYLQGNAWTVLITLAIVAVAGAVVWVFYKKRSSNN